MSHGAKCAGILIEGFGLGSGRTACVVGIGVNCAHAPEGLGYATSCLTRAGGGQAMAPGELFERLIQQFDEALDELARRTGVRPHSRRLARLRPRFGRTDRDPKRGRPARGRVRGDRCRRPLGHAFRARARWPSRRPTYGSCLARASCRGRRRPPRTRRKGGLRWRKTTSWCSIWGPMRKTDAPVLRHFGIALDHRVLHFDGAAHRIDGAAKLDDCAVARAFDDAPVMDGDGRVDQVAAQRPQPREDAVLVRSGKPAVGDHVRYQDRRKFSGFAHNT